MADPRFFDNSGAQSLAQVQQLTGATLLSGESTRIFFDVGPLDMAGHEHVAFCESKKFQPALQKTRAGVVITTASLAQFAPSGASVLETTHPVQAFARVATAFYPTANNIWSENRPPTSSIATSARIGEGATVSPGVYIGEHVEIGNNCMLGPAAVIGRGVKIGNNTTIGANASISHSLIGDRCIIHPGARIGQDGFGFSKEASGHLKIPQLGRVIIQDDVEIGANTTIDRGSLSDTVIGEGTKIDNLVQIGHNTYIGRQCIIAAQVGISGSCQIEDNVLFGGQVGVADHVTIGQNTLVAARSGVSKSLKGGRVYGGFPARPIVEWRREVASLARLAKRFNANDESLGNE